MTWAEIKKAVEDAGVKDDDEICVIQCENSNGSKSFQSVRLGKALKLSEKQSEDSRDFLGCAV